ncbi:MAG: glycosyltransferase family 4 protein [Pseudomonadota bacterium]
MKVAIIHDWCVVYGGAERVLEHIIDCYPQADIFSLIDKVPEEQRHFLRGKTVNTSFLQRIPKIEKLYRKLLFLMPYAIEQFDLTEYDLVISSSYCVAKGVLTGPNQLHVSYCHSPMRYAWDHYHEYLHEMNLGNGPIGLFAKRTLHKIRDWDVRSSNTVDRFVANSSFVNARIKKFYRRDSDIVFPPVETSIFEVQHHKEDYYVTAGRFVPFKRLDLVVDAFREMPDKKLIVVGDGPDRGKLESKAGSNVTFTGFLSAPEVANYLGRAKAFLFPSEEDFGIVPVEAQASGTPVIAFGSGGALETVVSPEQAKRTQSQPTGLFFNRQTPGAIVDAVKRFEDNISIFEPAAISRHASSFAPSAFKEALLASVARAWQEKAYRPNIPPTGSDNNWSTEITDARDSLSNVG